MRAYKKLVLMSLYIWMACSVIFPAQAWARKTSFIVVCAETGKVYTASDPDHPIPPASLTKMMTLYLTFKALREGKLTMNQNLSISHHATLQQPSKLWLKKGGTLTVRQAILGMVTKSANDATVVLAEALGKGSEKIFAVHMTNQAHKLGMKNTVFKNASGLPNKRQITTARDMATLSRALYKHFPEYFKFFSTKEFRYGKTVHRNHNHLLGKIKGVDGIKTGFTCASGFNLAASIVRNNHRIIAVVLGGETRHARDKKMTNLLEAAYTKIQGNPGKSRPSIRGLIHAHTLSTQKPPKKPTLKKHRKHRKKTKLIKANYSTLNELFHDLEASSSRPLSSLPLRAH
jgi:D-alanyl-D-alanine carboxypeptidase